MVDTKKQQRKITTPLLLTTQRSQHTQHLFTTPRPPSATPSRLKSYATNYAAPSYITKAPEYYTTEYTVPAYYMTTNAAPAYFTEAAVISIPKRSSTTPNRLSTLYPEVHNHNLGGQVLRSLDLQHSSCSFVQR
jgi:hypothetical protein